MQEKTKLAKNEKSVPRKKRRRSLARHQTFFGADFHQYDVRSDLAYFIPWDHIFLIRPQQTAESKWSGYDNGADTAAVFLKNQIADFAESFAVASVDHIFGF